TLVRGKKYASGSQTPSSTQINFKDSSNNDRLMYPLTVTGLMFKPGFIILIKSYMPTFRDLGIYSHIPLNTDVPDVKIFNRAGVTNYFKLDGISAYVTDTT